MKARLVLALLLAAAPACGRGRPETPLPNIVFFLVDDMGWMDSPVYGSRFYETPALERLAAEGLTFTDAYSASPLCSPTRASLLTGRSPARHRLTRAWGHRRPLPADTRAHPRRAPADEEFLYPRSATHLEPSETTIAEHLRAAGYRAAHIGKWHVGTAPEHWPGEQGFEVVFHGAPDQGPSSYFSPYGFDAGSIVDGPEGEYLTDRLTAEAVRFLRANRDRPFLLHLWHYGVHPPWHHEPERTARFLGREDPRGEQGNPIMASMLASVDASLGRVLDELDALGLAENTLVLFSSDNGGNSSQGQGEGELPPTSNAPLRAGKSWLYEGGTRVPLVVRWPGVVAPGSRSAVPVTSVDYVPTVLAAAGVETTEILDGVNLVPLLAGQPGQPMSAQPIGREALFWHFPHRLPYQPAGASVRRGSWKLLRWFETQADYPSTFELYDLAADAGESTNLAAERPELARELDALLGAHLAETEAWVPLPNPAYAGARDGD